MKFITTVTLVLALGAGQAMADCAAPQGSVDIPDGSAATRDEMVAAQKAVKAYDSAVTAFAECLQRAAGFDRVKSADEYARRAEAEADKLQKLADRFNNELRAFKARNTG